MPDRRAGRRLVAALALGVGVTVAIGSSAVAQEPAPAPWTGSSFDSSVPAPHLSHTFDVGGAFKRSGRGQIFNVDISFARGSYPTADASECTIPSNESDVPEVDPDNPPSTAPDAPSDQFRFRVTETLWPCNGNYTVLATATAAATSDTSYTMQETIRVEVPPVAVPGLQATVAGGEDSPDPQTGATADDPASVLVTWEKLDTPDETYPDFVGYRVQRAGPAADAKFATVSDVIGHESANTFNDTIEAPGKYRYRVQSLRAGPEGPSTPVPSADATTPSVAVDVAGPPAPAATTTTPGENDATTTRRRTFGLPDVNRTPSTGRTLTVPGPPTTVDDGFNDTLDYGDLPEPGSELAGEGQSVIQTEGEGAGLLGPVAGAMVLLGWAGHVAYLNRLAKQF